MDRIRVDAARARTGGAVARNGETFTACAAPDHVLVVGADASLSGCEFAASPAIAGDEIPEPFSVGAEGAGDRLRAAFASESFASLRTSLRQGLLPLRTCSRCARSLLSFRGDTAPCVRDYGSLLASAEPSPRRLVLMVPARGTPFAAALLASLPDLLTTVETVVLHGDDVLGHDGVGAVLDLVRAARPSNGGNAPRLALRTVHLAFDDAVKAQLEGQALASIEVLAEPASLSALAAAVALAEATSAAATATMTLAPASWFAIDEVARECDRLALPLTVRVSGHDGAPMARVDADGLQFAAKAFSALAAADSSQRPLLLSSENLTAVASDLRSLLRRDLDLAGDDAAPNEPAVALPMPTPEHAWLASESTWFVRHLMAEHRSRSLRNWLVGQADRSDFAAALAEVPWLRVLTQAVFASAKAGTCA
ncbi:MAG: hypothetical protein ABL997_17705, partial [Planctomycetota bacterium]